MRAKRQRIEGTLYRELTFRQDAIISEDERTVRVIASTENPVLRRSFFSAPWLETLGHKRTEVDLTRLQNARQFSTIISGPRGSRRRRRIGETEFEGTPGRSGNPPI